MDYMSRMTSPVARFRDLDLRRTAIHEHAHREVARRLGVYGFVRITPNPNGGYEQHYFVGKFFHEPIQDKRVRQMVALAGFVAECVDENPMATAAEIYKRMVFEAELSASDAEQAGSFERKHVAECLQMVQLAWNDIDQEASLLAVWMI